MKRSLNARVGLAIAEYRDGINAANGVTIYERLDLSGG